MSKSSRSHFIQTIHYSLPFTSKSINETYEALFCRIKLRLEKLDSPNGPSLIAFPLKYEPKSVFNFKVQFFILNSSVFSIEDTLSTAKPRIEASIPFEKWQIISKNDNIKEFRILIDVKKQVPEPKYVGLENEGMTCYLNASLQILFHLPKFRALIFQIPTSEAEHINESIPLSLQCVFRDLVSSRNAASTRIFTHALGWKNHHLINQQDTHEFIFMFLNVISCTIKDELISNSIKSLFTGETIKEFSSIDKKLSITRKDTFTSLVFPIVGNTCLNVALDKYIEEKYLGSENKICFDDFGNHEAVVKESFLKLPPVLFLLLERYSIECGNHNKVFDRFEYPITIDMSKYIHYSNNNAQETLYDLYGVVSHIGNSQTGHLLSYIRPKMDKCWYKFDDQLVSISSHREVFDINFGSPCNQSLDHEHNPCAYMLIYVNRSSEDDIFASFSEIKIPDHVLKVSMSMDLMKQDEKLKKENYLVTFYNQVDDSVSCKSGIITPYQMKQIYLSPQTKCEDMYKNAEKLFACSSRFFRIWKVGSYNIPTYVIPYSEKTLNQVFSGMPQQVSVFLQIKDSNENYELSSDLIAVYLKFLYNEPEIDLKLIHSCVSKRSNKIEYFLNQLPKTISIPSLDLVNVYLEKTDHRLDEIDTQKTFNDYRLDNGTILILTYKNYESIFPTYISEFGINNLIKIQSVLPDIDAYNIRLFIDDLFYTYSFYYYENPNEKVFSLQVFPGVSIQQIKRALNIILHYNDRDYGFLLYKKGQSNLCLIESFEHSSLDIVYTPCLQKVIKCMHVFSVMIKQNNLLIPYCIRENCQVTPLSLSKSIDIPKDNIRCYSFEQYKCIHHNLNNPIGPIDSLIYFEQIPEDQRFIQENERIVAVKSQQEPFVPFFIKITEGESFDVIKTRIFHYMNCKALDCFIIDENSQMKALSDSAVLFPKIDHTLTIIVRPKSQLLDANKNNGMYILK